MADAKNTAARPTPEDAVAELMKGYVKTVTARQAARTHDAASAGSMASRVWPPS
jgi:hypothetical protein